MVQCRLRELMAIRGRQTRRKVTYNLIRKVTGLSKNTPLVPIEQQLSTNGTLPLYSFSILKFIQAYKIKYTVFIQPEQYDLSTKYSTILPSSRLFLLFDLVIR